MPVGGWASALGAALQGGAQMYQGATRDQQQLELEKQRAADAHAMALLQKVIAQSQVDEIPKQHAAGDAAAIYQLSPEQAFDNPKFIQARAEAGTPVQTRPVADILKSRVGAIESGEGGPIPSQQDAADNLGMSPTTGAILPPELIATRVARQRQEAQAKFVMDFMQHPEKMFGDGGGVSANTPGQTKTGGTSDVNPMFDKGDAAMRAKLKFAGLEGILPSAQVPYQTQVNLAGDKSAAEAKAKAGIPGSPERMQSDKALTALQSIQAIKSSMEKIYPGITRNPMDATFNGPAASIGAIGRNLASKVWAGPITAVQANLARLLPQELGALVPGARGGQLVQLLSEAQGEFGKGGSPGSFMTKLLEAEKALQGAQAVSQNPTGAGQSTPGTPTATKSEIMDFAKTKGVSAAAVANELKAQGYQLVDRV